MTTREEAIAEKERLEAKFPDRRFVVSDHSSVRRVGRRVAAESGLEVVRDEGDWWVEVKVSEFIVLETRSCPRCGRNYTPTGDEDSIYDKFCAGCAKMGRDEIEAQVRADARREKRALDEITARDLTEE